MKAEWLDTLPSAIEELCRRWSLTLGNPIDSDEATCSWVAFATRSDGAHVVLKFGMPHMEGATRVRGFATGAARAWCGCSTSM